MEIIVHKPHGMNFDLDIIPYIHVSFQKSMNNFWYVGIGWLLWGVTFRKDIYTKKKQQDTYPSIYDVFNNKAQKGE